MAFQWLVPALKRKWKQQAPVSSVYTWYFSVGTWLFYAAWRLVKKEKKNSFNLMLNLPFVPKQERTEGWIKVGRFFCCTHSHHILSYTLATELFSCLYLWGKQAPLRAAPVWSIIKYNATWKCIRHETRVWTSHSDFLLVIHFVLVLMLTAAVYVCIWFRFFFF